MASQYSSGDSNDPAGTTNYVYDDQERLASQTDPDGNKTTFTYDTNDNKTSQADPDGNVVYYFYDSLGELCQRAALPAAAVATYKPPTSPCTASVSGATIDTQYTYDADGNQKTAKDALTGETITTLYDAADRPTSVTDKLNGTALNTGTTYSYCTTTPNHPCWEIETRTDPSGTYAFDLDGSGRATTMIDSTVVHHPSGNPFGWSYTASGALLTQTDPTGDSTTYTPDSLGRPAVQSTTLSANCKSSCNRATLGNTYNAAGNELTSTSNIANDPALGVTSYSYDQLSRLIGYTPAIGASTNAQTYAWDSRPDRTSIKTGTAAAVSTTYDAASRPTGASYKSDKEGRITTMPALTGSGTLTLTWDILGRLTGVANSAGSTSAYTYDPLDRLETIVSGTTTKTFAYVGLTDAVCETTTKSGANSVYTYAANDLDGTEVYEFSGSTNPIYPERNAHDDVTWTHDENGTPTGTAAYDPFGNLVAGSTTLSATRWQSSYQDDSNKLYYVVARWYAPSLGRFLSNDPLTADATDPQARDPYPYAAGDPIDGKDPSGQSVWVNYPTPPNEKADVPYLSVPFYSGNDSRWSDISINFVSKPRDTLGTVGCTIESIAMVLAYYDFEFPAYVRDTTKSKSWNVTYTKNGKTYTKTLKAYDIKEVVNDKKVVLDYENDPPSVLGFMRGSFSGDSRKELIHGSDVHWSGDWKDANIGENPGWWKLVWTRSTFRRAYGSWKETPKTYTDTITRELKAGRPVIAEVGYGNVTPAMAAMTKQKVTINPEVRHFVVITGLTKNGDMYMNDPKQGDRTLKNGSLYQFFGTIGATVKGKNGKKVDEFYQLEGIVTHRGLTDPFYW